MARLRVAVGVVLDDDGRVLIAQRAQSRHQGGLWEFPGGKIEAGESANAALARELHEEIGIEVLASEALIEVAHDYPDRQVRLEVYRVTRFRGTAHGREGQPLRWAAIEGLADLEFPEANRAIIAALLDQSESSPSSP
jgi:8-oxo-dGTP diphosphatase